MKATGRLALLTLLALLLGACGGAATAPAGATTAPAQEAAPTSAPAAGGKVPLTLWVFEGEEEFLPALKEAFEAKHPTITLEITQIPEDQYVTKIDTALAANDPPDIGFIYGGQQRWMKAAKFLPLDELFNTSSIDVDDYNQNVMSLYCQYEAKYYCVGSYTGAVVLLYNKDMFDAAGIEYPSATEPMTVDQYVALAARLSKPNDDIAQRVWGGSADTTYWYMDWATHFSADGKQAEGYINDAATIHAYDVLSKMVVNGDAPSTADMQMLGEVDLLAQQKQAMAITDNLVIDTIEAQNIRYGVAPPPVEQQGDKPFIITWSDAFGVFSESKHPEEAKAFLAFLATDGNRLRVQFNMLPLNLKLADELNWAGDNAGRQEMIETVKLARPVIFVPGFYEVTGPLGDAFAAMVEEQRDPKEAMDEAATQIQDSLNKAWETWDQIQ